MSSYRAEAWKHGLELTDDQTRQLEENGVTVAEFKARLKVVERFRQPEPWLARVWLSLFPPTPLYDWQQTGDFDG